MVTVRRVDFENLMIEIPEDETQPILVNWLDDKGKIIHSFKVENEESFENFMKELFIKGQKEESIKKIVLQRNRYPMITIPMKWFQEMGSPKVVKLIFDEVNEKIEIEVKR
jgi:hypothetical protein